MDIADWLELYAEAGRTIILPPQQAAMLAYIIRYHRHDELEMGDEPEGETVFSVN